MNAFSISLLAVLLLPLAGCGEKAVGSKTGAAAEKNKFDLSTARLLTPEEEFAETKKKAEAGDAEAQFNLGEIYAGGGGFNFDASGALIAPIIAKDVFKAFEWFKKSAEQGHANAQYRVGKMYYDGQAVLMPWEENYVVESKPHNQNRLLSDDEVFGNLPKAAEWWQKAAAQGHAEAQWKLGGMYSYGNGVPKDAVKAVEWYQKAAAQGLAGAQASLGVMYYKGEGVSKDAAKAVEWWQKAAVQGNVGAQFMLGVMYANGNGVPKDAVKAVEWYQKVAAQGLADAQSNLGWMYANGEGVPKDAVKAVEWYLKAAAQGYADAQYRLSRMYALGEGVSKDWSRAYAWVNLAAAQGNDIAKKARDGLETIITAAQRAEGQRLASNWKKGDTLQASSDNRAASPDGKPIKHSTRMNLSFQQIHNRLSG